jgi:hypothetical protein
MRWVAAAVIKPDGDLGIGSRRPISGSGASVGRNTRATDRVLVLALAGGFVLLVGPLLFEGFAGDSLGCGFFG